MPTCSKIPVKVDVIVPVYNAASTVREAVESAIHQTIPSHLEKKINSHCIEVTICCYDDNSTDNSWSILKELKNVEWATHDNSLRFTGIEISKGSDKNTARGAGYARNRAIELQRHSSPLHFLCLLDSDDIMHPHRIAEQAAAMLALSKEERSTTLLGCQFDRLPLDSTWHYSQWANNLTEEQLLLERFREVTILQPTWFLCRERFLALGQYVEAPRRGTNDRDLAKFFQVEASQYNRLVHTQYDNLESLRLAEDLRFFHDHLDKGGKLKLLRSSQPLVTYRHSGTSQSFRTSRKLLVQLRALAFERSILRSQWQEDQGLFIIWGAGRDGKDFLKALSDEARNRVYCFVDVDEKKLKVGSYHNRELAKSVPIIHFSFLISDQIIRERILSEWERGDGGKEIMARITKSKPGEFPTEEAGDCLPPTKKQRQITPLSSQGLELTWLRRLPVVVCVAKNRTNGVLERNVNTIGRMEGRSLWHFN